MMDTLTFESYPGRRFALPRLETVVFGLMAVVLCALLSPRALAQVEGDVPMLEELEGEWHVQIWCGEYLHEDESYRLYFYADRGGGLVLGFGEGPHEGVVMARRAEWDAEAGVLTTDDTHILASGRTRVVCRLRDGVLFMSPTYEDGSTPGDARLTREPLDNGATRRGRQASRAGAGELRDAVGRAQELYERALIHAFEHDNVLPESFGELLNAAYEYELEHPQRGGRGGLGGPMPGGGMLGGRGGRGGLGGEVADEPGDAVPDRPDAYDWATVGWLRRDRPRGFEAWTAGRRMAWVDERADYVLVIAGDDLGDNFPWMLQWEHGNPLNRGGRGGAGLGGRGRPGGLLGPGGLGVPDRDGGRDRPTAEEREAAREAAEREAQERYEREEARQEAWAAKVVLFELPRTLRQRTVSLCYGDGRVDRLPLREADAILREQTGADLRRWMEHLDKEVVPGDALLPRVVEDDAAEDAPRRPDRPGDHRGPGGRGGLGPPVHADAPGDGVRERAPHAVDANHPANGNSPAARAMRDASRDRLGDHYELLEAFSQDNRGKMPESYAEFCIYLYGSRDPRSVWLPWQSDEVPADWDRMERDAQRAWMERHSGYGYVGQARVAAILGETIELTGDEIIFFELPIYAGVETVRVVDLGGDVPAMPYADADALLCEQTGRGLMDWMDVYGIEQRPAEEAGASQEPGDDE